MRQKISRKKILHGGLRLNRFTLSTDRINNLVIADQLQNLCGETIEKANGIQKKKLNNPELPFDL